MPLEKKGNSVSDGVTSVTGTIGSGLGGVTKTVGGVVGTAGRGLGDTVNKTTGTKAGGDGLQSLTNSVEDGSDNMGKGVENASVGKKSW